MGTNEMATGTVNQSGQQKNNQWIKHLIAVNLREQKKNDLFQLLQNRKVTCDTAFAFIQREAKDNNDKDFFDFGLALRLLRNASPVELSKVELVLQRQIDTIRKIDDKKLDNDAKSRCIYALQNLIFSLSDRKFSNGKKNDFVPKILQDYHQMMLKGSTLGLDWDELSQSAYSDKYYVLEEPKWRFLDANLIKSKMDELAHYQAPVKEESKNTESKTPFRVIGGKVFWGDENEIPSFTDQEINQVLSCALTEFDVKDLKKHLPEFFNFVSETGKALNIVSEEIGYPEIHELVLATMHRMVEIGNNQQRKNLAEQTATAPKGKEDIFYHGK